MTSPSIIGSQLVVGTHDGQAIRRRHRHWCPRRGRTKSANRSPFSHPSRMDGFTSPRHTERSSRSRSVTVPSMAGTCGAANARHNGLSAHEANATEPPGLRRNAAHPSATRRRSSFSADAYECSRARVGLRCACGSRAAFREPIRSPDDAEVLICSRASRRSMGWISMSAIA